MIITAFTIIFGLIIFALIQTIYYQNKKIVRLKNTINIDFAEKLVSIEFDDYMGIEAFDESQKLAIIEIWKNNKYIRK